MSDRLKMRTPRSMRSSYEQLFPDQKASTLTVLRGSDKPNIIIVQPFRSSARERIESSLDRVEEQIRSHGGRSVTLSVSTYEFDPKQLITGFEKECERFIGKVTDSIRPRSRAKSISTPQPALVLIGEGFGAWIVEYCLVNHGRMAMTDVTPGVILIDVPGDPKRELESLQKQDVGQDHRFKRISVLLRMGKKILSISPSDAEEVGTNDKLVYDDTLEDSEDDGIMNPSSRTRKRMGSGDHSRNLTQYLIVLRQNFRAATEVPQNGAPIKVVLIDSLSPKSSPSSTLPAQQGRQTRMLPETASDTTSDLDKFITELTDLFGNGPYKRESLNASSRANSTPISKNIASRDFVGAAEKPLGSGGCFQRSLETTSPASSLAESSRIDSHDSDHLISGQPTDILEAIFQNLYSRFVSKSFKTRNSGSNPEEVRNLFKAAELYYNGGELDNADRLFARVLSLAVPNTTDNLILLVSHIRRASLWKQLGRYKEAREYFASIEGYLDTVITHDKIGIVEANQLKYQLCWWIALTSVRLGDYSKAIRAETEAIKLEVRYTQQPLSTEHLRMIFRARRLRAEVYARVGHFVLAEAEIERLRSLLEQPTGNGKGPETSMPAEASKGKSRGILAFTSATIYQLSGRRASALKKSISAAIDLKRSLGANNPKALEASSLRAHLLAQNLQIAAAEALCTETLAAMKKGLGAQHPVTLATISVLVNILHRQARFTEALDTARGLSVQSERVLGRAHPLTFESRSQLAIAHIATGQYQDAVEILDFLVKETRSIYRPNIEPPGMLRYRNELALAYLYCWEIESAEKHIREVISIQKHIFSQRFQGQFLSDLDGSKPGTITIPQITDVSVSASDTEWLQSVRQLLQDMRADHKCIPHPDLLFSLEILAKIEARKHKGDYGFATEILEAVCNIRKLDAELAYDTQPFLNSSFDLAMLHRDNPEKVQEAEKILSDVYYRRGEKLGAAHPDTLVAKRELLITRYCLNFDFKDFDFAKEAPIILEQLEWQLGKRHVEIARTLFAILGVQLLTQRQEAQTTLRELMRALRDETVLEQRFVESLVMQEQIAILYQDHGDTDTYHEIITIIEASLREPSSRVNAARQGSSSYVVGLKARIADRLANNKSPEVQHEREQGVTELCV